MRRLGPRPRRRGDDPQFPAGAALCLVQPRTDRGEEVRRRHPLGESPLLRQASPHHIGVRALWHSERARGRDGLAGEEEGADTHCAARGDGLCDAVHARHAQPQRCGRDVWPLVGAGRHAIPRGHPPPPSPRAVWARRAGSARACGARGRRPPRGAATGCVSPSGARRRGCTR